MRRAAKWSPDVFSEGVYLYYVCARVRVELRSVKSDEMFCRADKK